MKSGSTLDVQVRGYGGVPPTASSAVLNLTATNTTAASYLSVYPAGATRPPVSSLNWAAGATIPNLVTVPLGAGGRVSLFNFAGSADVVVDLEGFYAPPATTTGYGHYFPLSGFRILDTRLGYRPSSGSVTPVRLGGSVVPPGASAVLLNVGVTDTLGDGFLAAYPPGPSAPVTSNVNWLSGETRSNRVLAATGVGPDGQLGWVNLYLAGGSANLVVDVTGWFGGQSTPAAQGSVFTPVAPCRVADHVASQDPSTPAPVAVAGSCGIPNASSAVTGNLTVSEATGAGWLEAIGYPGAQYTSPTSDLNWGPGQTVSNAITVPLLSGGSMPLRGPHRFAPTTDRASSISVTVDVSGYFTPAGTTNRALVLYYSPPPARTIEVRVFDATTGQPQAQVPITLSAQTPPGSQKTTCSDANLSAIAVVTDSSGAAAASYNDGAPVGCLVTASDPTTGAGATQLVANPSMLTLTPTRQSRLPNGFDQATVTATLRRMDGTPHWGGLTVWGSNPNSLSGNGGPHMGQLYTCTTASDGTCSWVLTAGPGGPYDYDAIVAIDWSGALQATAAVEWCDPMTSSNCSPR